MLTHPPPETDSSRITPHSRLIWPRRIWAFIRLGRPIFLVGGVVMYLLGASVALYQGAHLDLGILLLGQIAITATQLMTHYANDYFDLEHDRANQTPTHWSGGSRVLVQGELPPVAALVAALMLAAAALFIAGWMGLTGRGWACGLILLGIVLAACYSAPPARLHTRGMGELSAAVIVSMLTPLTGYVVQAGAISLLALLATLPLLPLQLAMLVGVAFPDAVGDAHSGKHTLVVRLGAGSARLYVAAILGAFASLPLLALIGLPPLAAGVMALMLPLGAWQAIRVRRGEWASPAKLDSLAFGGISLLIGTAVLEALAFLALAGGA